MTKFLPDEKLNWTSCIGELEVMKFFRDEYLLYDYAFNELLHRMPGY